MRRRLRLFFEHLPGRHEPKWVAGIEPKRVAVMQPKSPAAIEPNWVAAMSRNPQARKRARIFPVGTKLVAGRVIAHFGHIPLARQFAPIRVAALWSKRH